MANQENLKAQLETQYNGKSPKITVDSIEPEAGPVYGETRVLVRGGPFENMVLLFPRPVCKFGHRDMIVAATYVSCTERPLSMEDTEGHHAERVSIAF
jgi:hypothetical protein